jgi:hypothetical protein
MAFNNIGERAARATVAAFDLEWSGNEPGLVAHETIKVGQPLDNDDSRAEQNAMDACQLCAIIDVRNRGRLDANQLHTPFNAPMRQIGSEGRQRVAVAGWVVGVATPTRRQQQDLSW